MKRFTLLLLALVMVVSVFAGCRTNPNQTTPKPTTPKKPSGDTGDIPEEDILNVDIDSIDYNQQPIYIFHCVPDYQTFEFTEFEIDEADIGNHAVKDAVYKKNLFTEQSLGVDLQFIMTNKGYNYMSQYMDRLKSCLDDTTTPIDIISGTSRQLPFVMTAGYLQELNTLADLDFEKSWWPGEVVEYFSVKDRLYFVSGDISTALLTEMLTIFVNKKTLEANGTKYDDFMTQYLGGDWTLDDLITLCDGMWKNGSDSKKPGPTVDDTIGFVTTWCDSDALYNGAGFSYLTQSTKDDEVFKLANDMLSESVDKYVTRMIEWSETYDFFISNHGEWLYRENFMEGRSLFCLANAWYGSELQNTEIDYAVVAPPKLDDNQDRYYTSTGTTYFTYGISANTCMDFDRAAQTLQCLGYYAKEYTTPAIFEISFQGKFAKDQHTIDSFELIRTSLTYDPGKYYDTYICGAAGNMWAYYPANIVSYALCGGDVWSVGGRVWKTEFNTNKANTLRGYISDANSKILAFLDTQ